MHSDFTHKISTFQQVSVLLLPKGTPRKFPISNTIFLRAIFETRQDPPGYKFFLHLPFLACRKKSSASWIFPEYQRAHLKSCEKEREGNAETKEQPLRNNSVAVKHDPSFSSRDIHNNIFEFFSIIPDGSTGKETACNVGDTRDAHLIPGSGRSLGEGNGNSLQYLLPEAHRLRSQSRTRLNNFHFSRN